MEEYMSTNATENTARAVAARYGVTRSTILKALHDGRLKGRRESATHGGLHVEQWVVTSSEEEIERAMTRARAHSDRVRPKAKPAHGDNGSVRTTPTPVLVPLDELAKRLDRPESSIRTFMRSERIDCYRTSAGWHVSQDDTVRIEQWAAHATRRHRKGGKTPAVSEAPSSGAVGVLRTLQDRLDRIERKVDRLLEIWR